MTKTMNNADLHVIDHNRYKKNNVNLQSIGTNMFTFITPSAQLNKHSFTCVTQIYFEVTYICSE